ncbi:MAG: hypothetical protein IJZ35_03170 [Clostridia bacterium]|nr:hypothetical protein [Clostridia bacterium]
MKNLKKILVWVGAIAIVAVCVISALTDGLEHIEDTNGADNYSLQTITDENIINSDIGAMGLKIHNGIISDTTTYSSDKFTGVEEIYGTNMVANRFEITVYHAQVNSGNFKIVLLEDDEIVHEFKLNELMQTYVLENPSGHISLKIAGESADFQLEYSIL